MICESRMIEAQNFEFSLGINVNFFQSAAKDLEYSGWTHTCYLLLSDCWINNVCIN